MNVIACSLLYSSDVEMLLLPVCLPCRACNILPMSTNQPATRKLQAVLRGSQKQLVPRLTLNTWTFDMPGSAAPRCCDEQTAASSPRVSKSLDMLVMPLVKTSARSDGLSH